MQPINGHEKLEEIIAGPSVHVQAYCYIVVGSCIHLCIYSTAKKYMHANRTVTLLYTYTTSTSTYIDAKIYR